MIYSIGESFHCKFCLAYWKFYLQYHFCLVFSIFIFRWIIFSYLEFISLSHSIPYLYFLGIYSRDYSYPLQIHSFISFLSEIFEKLYNHCFEFSEILSMPLSLTPINVRLLIWGEIFCLCISCFPLRFAHMELIFLRCSGKLSGVCICFGASYSFCLKSLCWALCCLMFSYRETWFWFVRCKGFLGSIHKGKRKEKKWKGKEKGSGETDHWISACIALAEDPHQDKCL